jgi:hypothetical protein
MRKREFLGISLFLIVSGLGLVILGILYTPNNSYLDLKTNGAVADGRVISYQLAENDGDGLQFLAMPMMYIAYQTIKIENYWIKVEFSDATGKTHQFRNDFVVSSSQKAMKNRLKIFYMQDDPSKAIVYDFFYFYGIPLILILTGIMSLAIGVFAYRL